MNCCSSTPNQNRVIIIAKYIVYLQDRFHVSPNLEIANCSVLPAHSTKTKSTTSIIVVKAFSIPKNFGIVKSESEKISAMQESACSKFSALKKIQAKTVKPKVNSMDMKSLIVGRYLP